MAAAGRRLAALALFLIAAPLAASEVPVELGNARGEINKEAYFKPGLAPVRNPSGYDVTVVYFMDYQCPACRKYTPEVARAFKDEPKVRVIYRDTPIFGPRSEQAARLAIASQFQGKHEEFHLALMESPMPLDEEALKAAAKKAGVDWPRLQADLEKHGDDIDLQIAWNTELSRGTGISGTPAFIVGDSLADGVLRYDGLRAEIGDARAASASARPETVPPKESKAPPSSRAEAPPPPHARFAEQEAASSEFRHSAAEADADEPAPQSITAWLWIGLGAAIVAVASLGLIHRKRRRR